MRQGTTFSRAEQPRKIEGFSPCNNTAQGLKPTSDWRYSGPAKAVP